MTRRPHRFWPTVGAVAYKEASILRHDKAFLSLIVMQPIIMLLILGFVISNKPANVEWAVWDRCACAESRKLVQDFQATGYFLPPRSVVGYDAGRGLLRDGEVLALLVIPETLARDLERGRPRVQLLLDGSDPLSAARIGGYLATTAAAFEPGPIAVETRSRDGFRRPPPGIDLRQRFLFNPTLSDNVFFLAAFAGILLTNFCLSVTSLSLVGERENGTYEQMLALPTTPIELVMGKLLPYVVISFGLTLYSALASGLVFGFWPEGSFLALLLVTLPFVLASLSIGVFVSTLANTSAQAVFITVFFIMPSFVLSGVLLPYQLMPEGIREVGGLLPLRWYQIATRRIIERGAGVEEVLIPLAALSAIFLLLLLAIRWRMKPRLG